MVAGVFGLVLWPIRRSMRAIRWAIVILIVGLAIGMNAPVWYIIAHINVIGGSGGYDRAFLLDTCAQHFKDWWLIGTNQNGNWGYDMWDQSDQFVAEAEVGGLVTLVCFIAIITKCFSRLGTMRKRVRPKQQWLLWCLGSTMLAHIFAYFGVAYWDQTQVWWFAFLAMICAVTVLPKPGASTKPAPATSPAVPMPDPGRNRCGTSRSGGVSETFEKQLGPGVPWNCDRPFHHHRQLEFHRISPEMPGEYLRADARDRVRDHRRRQRFARRRCRDREATVPRCHRD